jgi:anthranilate synthase component 2
MILLIDNYDSFSYNLYQFIGTINTDIKVIRNDELSVDKIDSLKPTHIVISPGPGKPIDAGVCEEVIKNLGDRYPILGVCLGHQAICEVYGATVDHASKLMHGKMSIAHIDTESKLFKGLDQDIEVARYHSLAAVKETLPDCLKVTAMTDDNEIMAVEHKEYNVYGVQFHPESILTPDGMTIIRNFLAI